MSRRTLTSLVRPIGGLFARSSAPMAARVPAKTFARFASTNADEGDGLLYELDMDHFKLIENAVVQLKYASACAQLKPGEAKPPAPEIEDPVKEHMLAEIEGEQELWAAQYNEKFTLPDAAYEKGLANIKSEMVRLGLGKDFPMETPSKETTWKNILEG